MVEVRGLTRRFGAKTALDDVDLAVPSRGVVGIVGENGAGKTTLIKHLLGLLRAQSGSVRLFGLDPVADPERVLSRVGYLSEEPALPAWMTIRELLRYTRAFYPGWDEGYADELVRAFELDPERKIKNLSKGQRARTGLVAAQAHRPDLLLLDEPSSGLDPIVRRDILAAIIRSVGQEGRSVVFSSHLLNEVEGVCDRIVMISRGKVVLSDRLEGIRECHHHVTLRLTGSKGALEALPGVLSVGREGDSVVAICSGEPADLKTRLARSGATVECWRTPSLDEVFVARSGVHPLLDQQPPAP